MATVVSVLGARAYCRLGQSSYVAATGNWTDSIGGLVAVQATSADRPGAGTIGTGTYAIPHFVSSYGVDYDYLTLPAITSLPTYSASDFFLVGLVLNVDSIAHFPNIIENVLTMAGGGGYLSSLGGKDTYSPLSTGTNYTVIVTGDGTSSTVYIDGSAPSQSGGGGGLGADWKTAARAIGGMSPYAAYEGVVGEIVFARSTSAFTSDIAAIHAALAEFITPAGGGPVTGTMAGTSVSSGTLVGQRAKGATFAGASAGTGTALGKVGKLRQFAGAAVAAATLAANVGIAAIMTAISTSVGTLQALLGKLGLFSGASAAVGTLAATKETVVPVAATLSGVSATTGALGGKRGKLGAMSGAAGSSGSLTATKEVYDPSAAGPPQSRLRIGLSMGL